MARARLGQRSLSTFEEPSINLTPLIDVVFVILIMFILVAPLLEVDRIELADAATKAVEESIIINDQSLITIHVYEDNTVILNKHPIAIDRLTAALKEDKLRFPEARPQVFHDRRAHFGTYQAVKNAIETAGFAEMDIILKPS